MPVLKRALIRDASYPQGFSAPVHVVCGCGTRVPVDHEFHNQCDTCGTIYDGSGWVSSAPLPEPSDKRFLKKMGIAL